MGLFHNAIYHQMLNRFKEIIYFSTFIILVNQSTASNEIMSNIPSAWAFDLAVSPDGNRLYVISKDGYGENVSVIDTGANAVIRKLTVTNSYGNRAELMDAAVHPFGNKLYVIAYYDSQYKFLSYIDTTTFTVTKADSFASTTPYNLAIKPDGDRMFVVSSGFHFFHTNDNIYDGSVNMGKTSTTYGNFIGYIADTVSGKVTQNNVGVAGVTLTVSGEGMTKTVLTDANGNYIMALKNGTYTITPARENMVFSPQNELVTIKKSVSGKDFKVINTSIPPTVTLSASPVTIQAGSTATLSWTSNNAATASIDNGIGTVLVNGSKVVTPTATTTYTITVSNTLLMATATARVTVTSPPPTVLISAAPATIQAGGSSTLTWISTNAASASIDNGIGSVPVNGSKVVTPAATSTYKITVTGPGGSNTAQVTVTVSVPPPTVTITATPDSIPPGGSSTLTWTSTNATSAVIDQGIGNVLLNGSLAVTPTAETIYTIMATGPGGTATASVTIKMLDSVLRNVWNGMKTAMIDANIEGAISSFSTETQSKYREIFTDLQQYLPQIASAMQNIELIEIFNGGAQYRIKRQESFRGVEYDITYNIYFIQEEDGTWKILKF